MTDNAANSIIPNGVRIWFQSLSNRERTAVQLFAIVVLFAIGIFAIFKPALAYRNSGLELYRVEKTDLEYLELNLPDLADANQPNIQEPSNNLGLVSRTATLFEIPLRRYQPSGSAIRVEVIGADFDTVVAWLFALRRDHDIGVLEAQFNARTGGRLDANILLQ